MQKLFMLFVAGGIGTLCRYGIVLACINGFSFAANFPLGTLVANLLGCFLAGIVWAFPDDHTFLSPTLRLILVAGFLGGLTTFSSFKAETFSMIQNQVFDKAILYFIASILLGFAFVFLGFKTSHYFQNTGIFR